uniref:UMP-CMP kinase (Trinotate prediction) n=1 Tax=Myxobolus squamalis TaxID=59785 RepID=A0A6B2G173_MYXSQ
MEAVKDKAIVLSMDSILKPSIVFVLGPPGSGKGTQCKLLADKYKIHHMSAGDLLRREKDSGSDVGKGIEIYMKEGEIVPVEITIGLLEDEMNRLGWSNTFLIDGFPRSMNNFNGWTQTMVGKVNHKMVIFLEAGQETSINRVISRSGSLSRVDDNPESLKKRWLVYNTITRPVVDSLEKLCPIVFIDAEKSIETVFRSVEHALKGLISPIL